MAGRLGLVYGGNFDRIADYIRQDPDSGKDLGNGHHVCIAELRYALENEMVITLRDFMERRATRTIWAEDGGLSITPPIADEMAKTLGWDDAEKQKQVEAYAAWVRANREPMGKTV